MLLLCAAGFMLLKNDRNSDDTNSPKDSSSQSSLDVFVENLQKVQPPKKFSIDKEYEDRKQQAKCNADVTTLNEEFANIWKEKVQIYNKKLIDYYTLQNNEDMLNQTHSMIEKWEEYCSSQIAYYQSSATLENSGFGIAFKHTNQTMLLYRTRAVELYELCELVTPGAPEEGDLIPVEQKTGDGSLS